MPRGRHPRHAQQAAVNETPPAVVMAAVLEPQSTDPLQRNRRIEDMGEAELRSYALQIGLSRRDAESLTVDRLRQCCLHRLYEVIEDL